MVGIRPIFINYSAAKALEYSSFAAKSMIGMGQTAPPLFSKKVLSPFANAYDSFIEFLARSIGKSAGNKYVKSIVERFQNSQRFPSHLAAICANVLNGFYLYNVYNSKKIEKEQKSPLMTNMLISTILATLGGYFLDGRLNGFVKKIENLIKKNYANSDNLISGLKVAKSLMIFQFLYRFISPVIATPLANKISNAKREKEGKAKLPV